MRVGARIAERWKVVGISQGELARRAGVSQPTIGKLEAGISSGSAHLHRIARALQTSPAYLAGEIDDPDADAPPPPPEPSLQFVTMQVALPPERALARMFEALLRMMPEDADLDERALLLARRLPVGLSQLRDLMPVGTAVASAAPAPAEDATPVPVPQS
jgi:transcriptional regulator with XRE-family HTH domain